MCNEIFIRRKHDQSRKGEKRGDSGRQGERRCISQGVEGGKQQDAGQGRNKNRPLTLSAVTRTAASRRGERSPNSLPGTKSCFWSNPEVSSGSCSTGCGSFKFFVVALCLFLTSYWNPRYIYMSAFVNRHFAGVKDLSLSEDKPLKHFCFESIYF